ncbi:protein jim lovell [Dendroctonus ponderosae]|uniref:protein jim lovell n=1 Tax=Dendroctonus ponderosae TaxID=77166 RepID=UPI0020366233|nr:protein jim lovell [Dendroctonus ponderosae]KAH1025598.1 hypothetical protein HUJ05_010293 [Dendroctonus ponderosae]KAH1025599.1 hypothetical protein HUJ05_010293 [Dendroctonus ponderosae]KAH1025600.1 hypothetical protein HUJ05_010293 [Dendroctonus ponderosae]
MNEQDMTMTESHYSLRWNNHQSHILASFEALLEAETLVDVTLVCADTSIRAHKVVLSACSTLFQRIFLDHPCKHPVIILSDFSGWVIQAIVAFIYKGEVNVLQDQLQALIKAAESLQIRGLANQDQYSADKESTSIINQTPTPSTSPNDYDKYHYNNIPSKFPSSGRHTGKKLLDELPSPFSPIPNNFDCAQVKLPHMSKLSFPEALMPRSESPTPRRKQARPRRRSGDLSMHRELNCTSIDLKPPSPSHSEETAEDLCMKKSEDHATVKEEERKSCTPEMSVRSPELDMSTQSSGKEFRSSPVSAPQPTTNMKQEINNPSPLPYPPMPTTSTLALTPPPNKYFGLDSPLGFFPHGYEGCRSSLFDFPDNRNIDAPSFVKKKMGRPKGQHSAPRGGPPRSWTNNELTEALGQVWKKRMTTSQASRIYGIPYNSLLMYVRGKYGKSLKLEQLRRDCLSFAEGAVEILGNIGNNNNLTKGSERDQEPVHPNVRPPVNEHDQHQMFHPFNHNYYPDFGTGFRLPLNMIHLLPQAGDKNRTEHNAYGQTALHDEELSKSHQGRDIEEDPPIQDLYRPPTLNLDDRRELVQQNGQD